MAASERNPRWYCPTSAWLVILSLAVTAFLFLSQRYQSFSFNEHKGWTVLIAVSGLGIEKDCKRWTAEGCPIDLKDFEIDIAQVNEKPQ